MFKWPGKPSARAPENELADFAELLAWQSDSISTTALTNLLGRYDDNDYSSGVQEAEEPTEKAVEEAYLEIERRREACGDGYPFKLDRPGYTLQIDADQDSENHKLTIYKYLLLATRLNMRDDKGHANIDGTLLFEELAAEAAREYLGNRAESLVFGTASGTEFHSKVNTLCQKLKEGDGFVNRDEAAPTARDGKLDVVVWKHFTDGLEGKLIAFGQCKTGTNYKDTLTQLQPDSFCGKWMRSSPVVLPVRMFFVSEALSRGHWRSVSRDAGLLFDRCRIVDFCDNISANILERVRAWTTAASEATRLPRP